MFKRVVISAAVLVLAACGATAATAAVRPGPDLPARCATVTVAFRTPTGHEADLPVKVCGGIGKTGSYQCDIAKGELDANARLTCLRLTVPVS